MNAQCFKSGLFEQWFKGGWTEQWFKEGLMYIVQWFKGDRDACAQCIGLIKREYFLGGLELHEEVMEFWGLIINVETFSINLISKKNIQTSIFIAIK